jgi:hypothetical protein
MPSPKGRPRKKPEERVTNYPERYEFKMTKKQKETLINKGGAAWIRERLDKE